MEACIVICSNCKPIHKQGKVLFINAVNEITRCNALSFLTNNHIKKISDTYHSFEEIEGFSNVVDIEEISRNKYNLTISLYAYQSLLNRQETVELSRLLSDWIQQKDITINTVNDLLTLIKDTNEN